MKIAKKINQRNPNRFLKLTRCNASHHSILYCMKITCAKHPEHVHREHEKIYWYKHGPNHCPLSMLYLAQMQNQHRWRADANSDQWKHGDLGCCSLQWNTIRPVKPPQAATCATFLCCFTVFSYILRILVWKANLKGWHEFTQITHAHQKAKYSLKQEQRSALVKLHVLSSTPVSPHLDRTASVQPWFLPSLYYHISWRLFLQAKV